MKNTYEYTYIVFFILNITFTLQLSFEWKKIFKYH